jgi:F-type H+-transporting ATPase subunit c
MDSATIIGVTSIITSGFTIAIGALGPAPDASSTITRTLFVGLAMIESLAIYCFVVSMILIFANPFWTHLMAK